MHFRELYHTHIPRQQVGFLSFLLVKTKDARPKVQSSIRLETIRSMVKSFEILTQDLFSEATPIYDRPQDRRPAAPEQGLELMVPRGLCPLGAELSSSRPPPCCLRSVSSQRRVVRRAVLSQELQSPIVS